MLFQSWANVEDGGPTLKQHWANYLCLLGVVVVGLVVVGPSSSSRP